jgi:pyrroline-5-carboxylate reductase
VKAVRKSATVFLGGGRITSALVAGLRLSGYEKPIVVHDRHPRKVLRLKQQYRVVVEHSLGKAVQQAHLLIIAVRPNSVRELLDRIGKISHPVTAVSLAAGVPLSKLRARLGPPVRWARAMPSPVCRSGRGLTAVVFDPELSRSEQQKVKQLFARVGLVVEIPENQFDAFTVTYSCSHGYHALAVLAAAAQKLGLSRRMAQIAALHALTDGLIAWREGKTSLQNLLHEAATPGGISAAAMASMKKSGYSRAVERGLRAGMARARKNAKR